MAKISPIQTRTKDGAPLLIRAADEADASACLALYRAVIEEGPYTMLEPNELTRSEQQEAIAIRSDSEHAARLRLVASARKKLVGMVRVACGDLARTSHFGDIDSMRVLPDWRGQGIGGALLDALIAWATTQLQIEKLGLYVFSTSGAAIQLYLSRGFIEEGRGARDIKFGMDEYAATVMMGLHIRRETP
jgi:ribosomal protein S18 acetylase RimI-like enzyme